MADASVCEISDAVLLKRLHTKGIQNPILLFPIISGGDNRYTIGCDS